MQVGGSGTMTYAWLPHNFSGSDLSRAHLARVLSNTSQDPLNTGGLKRSHHTFDVLALYDLVTPSGPSNNCGITLQDTFTGSGPTRDRLNLSVAFGANSG